MLRAYLAKAEYCSRSAVVVVNSEGFQGDLRVRGDDDGIDQMAIDNGTRKKRLPKPKACLHQL